MEKADQPLNKSKTKNVARYESFPYQHFLKDLMIYNSIIVPLIYFILIVQLGGTLQGFSFFIIIFQLIGIDMIVDDLKMADDKYVAYKRDLDKSSLIWKSFSRR